MAMQITRLKEALEEHEGHPEYLLLMAGDMGDGWNRNTVRNHLKRLGLLPGRRKPQVLFLTLTLIA